MSACSLMRGEALSWERGRVSRSAKWLLSPLSHLLSPATLLYSPFSSASLTTQRAALSLTLPPGCMNSAFP